MNFLGILSKSCLNVLEELSLPYTVYTKYRFLDEALTFILTLIVDRMEACQEPKRTVQYIVFSH
jgi:hypothetical protein